MQRRFPETCSPVTRICQLLNACMWKQPQIMVNLSKRWWREEISWLSHVVAYYPSNQPACALHSHLQSTRIENAPQRCHLAQNTSHPLKDINIIVGSHIWSNGQGETSICLQQQTFVLCGLFTVWNFMDFGEYLQKPQESTLLWLRHFQTTTCSHIVYAWVQLQKCRNSR